MFTSAIEGVGYVAWNMCMPDEEVALPFMAPPDFSIYMAGHYRYPISGLTLPV